MFSGIVEFVGTVAQAPTRGRKSTLAIGCPKIKSLALGSSLAVNGVCLTVSSRKKGLLYFDLLKETLRCTNLGFLHAQDLVNLERALVFGKRIEGHLVQGHVDGVGKILKVLARKKEKSFLIGCPARLRKFLLEKGSITVNGVSLTLGKIERGAFGVHCVAHTLKNTNLGGLKVGSPVNLEVDLVAKAVLL